MPRRASHSARGSATFGRSWRAVLLAPRKVRYTRESGAIPEAAISAPKAKPPNEIRDESATQNPVEPLSQDAGNPNEYPAFPNESEHKKVISPDYICELAASCEELPEALRAAIITLVRSASKEGS